MAHPPPARIPGHRWFFPAATLYAIVVLPASVAAMLGALAFAPGLASPGGHAHEMLFGFALAVVAGNQLGPRTRRTLALLVAAWLVARVAFVFAPGSALAVATNALFPALLAWQVAPRLIGSAKKWRNQALPAALLAICASAVALTVSLALQHASRALVDVAVALFALLLLFMGGRLIAPTVAGQLYRQGGNLDARVQPRIEGALIVAMASAIAVLALEASLPTTRAVRGASGALLVVAGALAAIRLSRWQLWRVRRRPDLWSMGAGYAWLAVGLAFFGLTHAGLAGGDAGETLAIHVITIGSLGTLTLNVMAMTRLLTLRRAPPTSPLALAGTLLLATALLLRVLAGTTQTVMLAAAAACWSGAYALLLVVLLTGKRGPPLRARKAAE